MNLISILAIATTIMGIAMSLSYFVQIRKILITKSAKSHSLLMWITFSIGLLLWLLYGIAMMNWPLIIVNSISMLGVAVILFLVIKYRNK